MAAPAPPGLRLFLLILNQLILFAAALTATGISQDVTGPPQPARCPAPA